MAYKVQIGPAKLAGSITTNQAITSSAGFNAGEGDVVNVGQIKLDSISADVGGNGEMDIILTDNEAEALEIKEGSNLYMKFVTTNSSEQISVYKNQFFDGNAGLAFRAPEQGVSSPSANELAIDASASINFSVDGGLAASLTSGELEIKGKALFLSGAAGKMRYGANMESGKFLVSDGTDFESVAMSGDATLAANGALTIGTGVVEHAMLAADCIDGDNIQDDVVNSEHLAAGAIDTEHIGALQVTNGKLAASAVTTAKLSLGSEALATGADHVLFLDGGASGGLNTESVISFANKMSNGSNSGLDDDGAGKIKLDIDDLAAVSAIASGDTFAMAQQGESGDPSKKITIDNIATKLAGDGLAAASGVLAVGVDDSSIELNSDALRVKASGVTNAMLAGSIANAKLANSAVTVTAGDGLKTGGSVSLGGSVTLDIDVSDFAGTGLSGDGSENLNIDAAQTGITSVLNSALVLGTAADQEYIDFSNSNQIHIVVNDTPVARAVAGTFIVDGNLHVSGTTTAVDSTTIQISSSFTFEGPVDAHETILSCGTPTQDNTITLPQFSGSAPGTYHMAVLADATTEASAKVTAAEFALLDGGTARGTTALASGDGFLHNDGGTMRMTSINKLADHFAADGLKSNASGKMELDINSIGAAAITAVAQADVLAVVDSAGGNITKKITFSNFEDEIFGNVSGDALIAAGGALTIQADAVESGMLNDNVISGQTELSAADIVDADEMMISDGGVLKKIGVDNLKDYMGREVVALKDNGNALVAGINYFADLGGAESCTLPDSPAVGTSVRLKAPSNCSSTNTLTVNRAGSNTIDGENSVVMESPHAAVEFVYVATNLWKLF